MKFFDKNICLTDRKNIVIIFLALVTTTVLASVFTTEEIVKEVTPLPEKKI